MSVSDRKESNRTERNRIGVNKATRMEYDRTESNRID